MGELTIDQVIEIHTGILEKSGDDRRLLSEANLHQMVFRVNCTENPLARAAMAAFLLVAYPPFRDGNKRTACGVLELLLARDGYRVESNGGSLADLLRGVNSFTIEPEDIEKWLYAHAQKTGLP